MQTRRTVIRELLGLGLAGALPASAQELDESTAIKFMMDEADQLAVNRLLAFHVLERMGVDTRELPDVPAISGQFSLRPFMSRIIDDLRDGELRWWDVEGQKPQPGWAELPGAIDYAHLVTYAAPKAEFELKATILEFLMARNSFVAPLDQRKVVFGLRGCTHVDANAPGDWVDSVKLRVSTPDHVSMQCVIGLWDRQNGKLWTFPASTVPEVSYMFLYYYKLAGCNLLPTGFYSYRVDTHRPSSDNPQHGALCQSEPVVVLRSPSDLVYSALDLNEAWESGKPGDNIHAAHYYAALKPPRFSSAGCQVIAGKHEGYQTQGPWSAFRTAAGIVSGAQSEFRYVLLTGLEAALAAERTAPFDGTYRRVRFGSTGPNAKALQEKLGIGADGDFRKSSVLALLRHRIKQKELETPIAVV